MKTSKKTETVLTPDPQNPNRMAPEDKARMAKSLTEFGDLGGIILNRRTGFLIGGHQRTEVLAGAVLNVVELPTPEPDGTVARGWLVHVGRRYSVRVVDWPPEKAHAALLAANRFGRVGKDDDDQLRALLKELDATGMDMDLTGFDIGSLADLDVTLPPEKTSDAEPQVDRAAELNEKWKVVAGDLFTIGGHRLLCGDSTKADDVARVMGGEKADMMLTDPPYNVALGMNETPEQAKARNRRTDGNVVTNDHMSDDDFRAFLVSCFRCGFDCIKPGGAFYVWHADSEGFNFRGAIRDCGEKVRQCLVWAKDVLVMGRQDYQWQHEPCLYGWKEGAAHGWYSDRKQTTLLRFDRPSRSQEHPTMKPVALFAYLVGNSTAPQGLAYDPFLGSGTTMVAAQNLGRKCYGLEISPDYCAVILERMATAFPALEIKKA